MQNQSLQKEFLKPVFIINSLIRHRWLFIVPLLLALAAGSHLAVQLPKIYEAQTLILVESQRVPTNYVQSVVSTDVAERITTLSQQILSRTNLEKIIERFNIFSEPEFAGMYKEDMVNILRTRINVAVTHNRRETNSFSISYRDTDPELAMNVTNSLASYFIEENLRAREAQAIGTSEFLEAELNSMRRRLEEKETALQAFRTRHMGELPEQLQTNLRVLDRLQEQLTERQESLRDAKSRLAMLQTQPPTGILAGGQAAGAAGPAGPDPLDPEALRAELARLQMRYTDKHPDIIKIKQQIEDLEAESASAGTEPLPREPLQIREVRREIANISEDINRIQSDIAAYDRRVETTPTREQELLALQRDYQNLQDSYSSLLNRKLEADISVNMERKQKGEQFRILDRARRPQRPVEPNMQLLFLITVAAGFGIGGGLIFLKEYLSSGFRTPKEAEIVLGLPTIATIPYIENPKSRLLRNLNWIATGVALTAASVMLVFFTAMTLGGVKQTSNLIDKVKDTLL